MATNTALSKSKFLGLIPLVMAQIGTSGDNSVLTVATASLLASLNATMADIQLANIIYSLCAGCLMIVGGMVGLIVGWKKTFRVGALLCIVGEVTVAFSSNIFIFTWGGRLLVDFLKEHDDIRLSHTLAAPGEIMEGLLSGRFDFGFLIDTFDWRVAFTCMAVYFAIVLTGSALVGDVPLPEQKVRFDLKGSLVAVAGLFLLIIGISKIPVWGLLDPISPPVIGGTALTVFGLSPALFIAILGLITLGLLVRIERNVEKAYGSCLIPSSFLTTPQVRSGLYLTAMLFLCFGGSFFLVITYLQLVAGFSGSMPKALSQCWSSYLPAFLANTSRSLAMISSGVWQPFDTSPSAVWRSK
jgi:MFS family permease